MSCTPVRSTIVPSVAPVTAMPKPPQTLRIKRKRNQDPLQALILGSKRVKLSLDQKSYYFQLERTVQVSQADSDLGSVLHESSSVEGRHFVIPKRPLEEDAVIPNELADMVQSFLSVNDNPSPKKRKRRGLTKEKESKPAEPLADFLGDYVFDVYTLSEPLTSQNFPQSEIGYIKFFDDKDYDLMNSDDDSGSGYSDNEDSNAESFYQNDYPEDEDAGAFSETYDESEDDAIGPVILETPEDFEGNAYLRGHEQAEGQFDDLYDDFFDGDNPKVNFLNEDYTEEYERNSFFQGDEDDHLAQHRDRIFGRLQKMIDEA